MTSRRPRSGERSNGANGTDVLGGAFHQVVQGLLLVQEALREQEQQAERRTQEALRLQEDGAVTALREVVRKMQQEKQQTIRDLLGPFNSRMQELEERMNRAEEQVNLFARGSGSGESGGKEMVEKLNVRMGKLEASVQRALSSVFPRVESLVARLEESSPPEAPHVAPSASSALPTKTSAITSICTSSSVSSSISTSSSRSISNSISNSKLPSTSNSIFNSKLPSTSASTSPRPPAASQLTATSPGVAAPGAGRHPNAGIQDAAARDEEKARKRVQLKLQQFSSKWERTKASPSALGEQLCKACRDETLEEVRRLLDSGADVNYINSNGSLPLKLAVIGSELNKAIVSLLLERGADPDAVDSNGTTALHSAAICDVDGSFVALLIGGGANVDSRAKFGATPLHFAAYKNNEVTARTLLAAGARKSLKAWDGAFENTTPLDLASSDAIRRLLRQ